MDDLSTATGILLKWCLYLMVPILAIGLIVQLFGSDGSGDNSGSNRNQAAESEAESEDANFLASARSSVAFPDDDIVLAAVGRDICFEIDLEGEREARANLSRSSFSSSQQSALFSAAKAHLC